MKWRWLSFRRVAT